MEIDKRRETVASIENFTNTYAACPVVVTSRFVGYWDAPLTEDFLVHHLASFDEDEVEAFAYKFIKIIEVLKKQEAEAKARRFLAQTTSVAADLRENPLMLGLMVYLFMYRGDVPSNRPEIYKECATLMFEKWDQRRDIIFKIPSDFDLLDLFSHLASKIFGNSQTEDGVSREWLLTQVRSFFEGWYLDKAKAHQAARSLVDFITGRAWVMYDVGPNVYQFTHRTFLEYFFARHLLSSSDSINSLIRVHLLGRIMNSEWDVVSNLALQTAVFRDAGKMGQAANTIEDVLKGAFPNVRSQILFLLFVSKALEYLLLPERRYYEIISLVGELAVEIGAHSDTSAISVIRALIWATKKREGISQEAIFEVIRAKAKGSESAERTFAMFVLCPEIDNGWIDQYFDGPAPWWRVGPINSSYFLALRDELRTFNFDCATNDPNDARLYILVYRDGYERLFKKFGLMAFYGGESRRIANEIPDLIQIAVAEVAGMAEIRRKSSYAKESDSSTAVAFVRLLVEGVRHGERMTVSDSYGVAPSSDIAEAAVHSIWELAVETKSPNLEFLTQLLLSMAIALDVEKVLRPGPDRNYGERPSPRRDRQTGEEPNRRLLSIMPPGPMEQLLKVLKRSDASGLFLEWNSRNAQFAAGPS